MRSREVVYAWLVPTAAIAVLALIVALNAPAPGAAGGETASRMTKLELTLSEHTIAPGSPAAPADVPIEIHVHNAGTVQHNLVVTGHGSTAMIDPGADATLKLDALPAGSYELLCAVAGHADLGMRATLLVGAAGALEAAPGTTRMSADEMDASYMAGVKAFPAKTKGLGGQALQPRLDGSTKVFDLTSSEIEWETAPGEVHAAMAFNGMVPGPQIRVARGDTVRVVLHNRLEESTAIHFHGLDVPNDQDGVPGLTQEVVKPGADHTSEFTVTNCGSNMYHSHMDGSRQIPMGLLGAFIVDCPGEPHADVDTTLILNDGPLGYTLNGKSFPATQPIAAKPGQVVRIRYMNEGLQGHPMHLHGMPQTVIARDGYPLPAPFKADTIWVAPGERYDVLVTVRPGLWAFHCHILAHAETQKGMFGMVTVVAVT